VSGGDGITVSTDDTVHPQTASTNDHVHRVRIEPGYDRAVIAVDGHNLANHLNGYSLHQEAGKPPELVLSLSPSASCDTILDGLARVTVGEPPDPGPAAAAFLDGIDARELERTVLARHDLLDGGPHELTRAMLVQLQEWARGEWAGWEPATDGDNPDQPRPVDQ
jgi:hypothetical protein